MEYSTYTVEDFVADPSFVRWVKASEPKSETFWDEWIEQHPKKLSEVEEAKRLVTVLHSSAKSIPEFTAEDLSNSKKFVLETIQSKDGKASSPPIHRAVYRYHSLAAAIVLVVISSFVLWWFLQPADQIVYRTDYGEVKTIVLPDQTAVTLNANSTLHTLAQWNKNQPREVWLRGEAFFDVTHQNDSEDGRFLVHTDLLEVEVLGTEFNVNHRRGMTQVVLTQGKVNINPSDNILGQSSQSMQPGDMILTENQQLILQQVDVEKYIAWRNNRLYFEEETLANIAIRLEDSYGLQMRFIEPSLADLVFTGSTPTNDLSILFIALSEALNIKITQEENLLLIQPNQPS